MSSSFATGCTTFDLPVYSNGNQEDSVIRIVVMVRVQWKSLLEIIQKFSGDFPKKIPLIIAVGNNDAKHIRSYCNPGG